jgi:hypothetical protein
MGLKIVIINPELLLLKLLCARVVAGSQSQETAQSGDSMQWLKPEDEGAMPLSA